MSPDVAHPSAEQLEAAAFGWLTEAEAEPIRRHARGCGGCAARLASEEQVRRPLVALRRHEPRVSAVESVLSRLERDTRNVGAARSRVSRVVMLGLVLTGVVISGRVVAARRTRARPPRSIASLPRLWRP